MAAVGRRNKVPLEKGFSQVDWLRLAKSGVDLKGAAGQLRSAILCSCYVNLYTHIFILFQYS